MTDETNTNTTDNEVQNEVQNEPKKTTTNGWAMNPDNTGYSDSGTPIYLGD